MTEKNAIHRTHRGKVLHAPFRPTTLKLDGETAPYEVLGANAGDIAHGNMVDYLGKVSKLINGQLDQSSDAKLISDN